MFSDQVNHKPQQSSHEPSLIGIKIKALRMNQTNVYARNYRRWIFREQTAGDASRFYATVQVWGCRRHGPRVQSVYSTVPPDATSQDESISRRVIRTCTTSPVQFNPVFLYYHNFAPQSYSCSFTVVTSESLRYRETTRWKFSWRKHLQTKTSHGEDIAQMLIFLTIVL